MTIAKARAAYEAQKSAYDKAQAQRHYTDRSFENFLVDEGFSSIWSDNTPVVKAEASWGHRHGQRLQYGDHELRRWPSPRKLHALLTGKKASEYDDGAEFG